MIMIKQYKIINRILKIIKSNLTKNLSLNNLEITFILVMKVEYMDKQMIITSRHKIINQEI